MRLIICLLLPTVSVACLRTATTTTTTNRADVSQDASRLAQRAPLPCSITPFRLCLEGWICDSSSASMTDGHLQCTDGSAILVMEGNSLILATKSECKEKQWLINDKKFPREVEITCGSVVPHSRTLRRGRIEDAQDYEEEPSTTPKVDDWAVRFREVQERVHENDQLRRRLVQKLNELRKKGEMDRETTKRIQNEIVGHNTIRQELNHIMQQLRKERSEEKRALRTKSTTNQRLALVADTLSSQHVPSYAESLALQGYEAMPQIYGSRPPNPFDGIDSIDGLNLPINALKPYTSFRRCGRILQSTSDCPDGRICSSFSHLGEHRITCPNGHVAVELPDGFLELMVSSLVCPEGGSEWIAENEQGQRGQRVGVDVTVTCIQECACTPLSASPTCPPSHRCSPASFLVDIDDQCMLYECGEGKTLLIRSRYGWQPASHLVCGPGGDYLLEGKDKVGPNPTVTCIVEGSLHYTSHHRRRNLRRHSFDD